MLELENCPVDDTLIQGIAEVPALRYLELSDCELTARSSFAGLHQLEDLDLEGCVLNRSILPALAGLAALEKLVLDSTAVDDAA